MTRRSTQAPLARHTTPAASHHARNDSPPAGKVSTFLGIGKNKVAEQYPEGLIYIGGIAVYLHAINSPKHAQYAETTHDADFYISAADLSDLREIEEVRPNRRLNRHQFIREGFEFDIYAKYQSNLRVPYDAVSASCDTYGGIQVACLEHRLVLKLDSFAARHASAHGRNDARDLIRLALVASEHPFQSDKVSMFLDAEHLKLLAQVARGPEPTVLTSGNAHLAKNIRATFSALVATLR